ncbi:4-coumarate--CoA ligase-like 7 [Termitomyces sp. T112]|nr:4-coumarate--CoA ligase-like 7 [Termitomyces sp. T112]
MEVYSTSGPLPDIPDYLTVPQFIFDYQHECRPVRIPSATWLIEDETGRGIGEEELRRRTFGLANALKTTFGIEDGDVVLIFSRNHVDYPVAIWAIHRLGAVVSGANPDFSSDELFYQLEQTNASLVIAHPDSIDTARSAVQRAKLSLDRLISFDTHQQLPNDSLKIGMLIEKGLNSLPAFVERQLKPGEAKTRLAFLNFSSGTTGKPKAVAIPHYSLITNVIQIAAHNKVNQNYCDIKDQRFRPGDICIGVLPFYHIYGLVINLHFVLFSAMSVVIVPKFSFTAMLDSIVRHRISHLMLVPPQVVLLCKHPVVKNYNLRQFVRMIMCGAAPLSHEVNQQLFELLPDAHIGQAYGMTETCTATSMWPITQKRGTSGSAGQLLPGIIARAIKADGSLAGFDEVGELYIKTPSVALGYVNNAEATKETFIDGWVRTGDEVKIDKNGELWILDRLKEIMKVKGFQVSPAELEGCILDHADVAAACVVGIPDDYSGEVPLAFVVLTATALRRVREMPNAANEIKTSIIKHVAENKVHYKHLVGGVEFISSIPTSPSGKMLRRVLRDEAKVLRKTKSKL